MFNWHTSSLYLCIHYVPSCRFNASWGGGELVLKEDKSAKNNLFFFSFLNQIFTSKQHLSVKYSSHEKICLLLQKLSNEYIILVYNKITFLLKFSYLDYGFIGLYACMPLDPFDSNVEHCHGSKIITIFLASISANYTTY